MSRLDELQSSRKELEDELATELRQALELLDTAGRVQSSGDWRRAAKQLARASSTCWEVMRQSSIDETEERNRINAVRLEAEGVHASAEGVQRFARP